MMKYNMVIGIILLLSIILPHHHCSSITLQQDNDMDLYYGYELAPELSSDHVELSDSSLSTLDTTLTELSSLNDESFVEVAIDQQLLAVPRAPKPKKNTTKTAKTAKAKTTKLKTKAPAKKKAAPKKAKAAPKKAKALVKKKTPAKPKAKAKAKAPKKTAPKKAKAPPKKSTTAKKKVAAPKKAKAPAKKKTPAKAKAKAPKAKASKKTTAKSTKAPKKTPAKSKAKAKAKAKTTKKTNTKKTSAKAGKNAKKTDSKKKTTAKKTTSKAKAAKKKDSKKKDTKKKDSKKKDSKKKDTKKKDSKKKDTKKKDSKKKDNKKKDAKKKDTKKKDDSKKKKDSQKKVLTPEEKAALALKKKEEKQKRLSEDTKKKQDAIIDQLKQYERATLSKIASLPDGPEKEALKKELFKTQVSQGLKYQSLEGFLKQQDKNSDINAQNKINQLTHKPAKTKQYNAKECAKDPSCPLREVKDHTGKDITKQVQDAFKDGKFKQNVYDKPTTLYRCTNGERDEKKGGAGSWWTKTIPKDSVETMKRLAISKDWGTSQLKKCYKMTIPAGVALTEGTAGPQKDSTRRNGLVRGGGSQTFIPTGQANQSWFNEEEIDLANESWSQQQYMQKIGNMEVDMSQYSGKVHIPPSLRQPQGDTTTTVAAVPASAPA